MGRRERVIIALAAAGVAGVCCVAWLHPGGPWTRHYLPIDNIVGDEGTVLYDSLRIAHGQAMYRDFFSFQGPVFYHLYAAVLAVAGASVFAARFVNLLVIAAGAACLALLVRRLLGRAAAAGAVGVYVGALVSNWPAVYPSWLAQTLVLGALALLDDDVAHRRRLRACGALLGLATCTLVSFGVPALVALTGAQVAMGLRDRRARAALADAGAVLAGAAAVFAVVVALLAARRSLGAFAFDTLVWPFRHYGAGQWDAEPYGAWAYLFVTWNQGAPAPWRSLAALVVRLVEFLPIGAAAGALAAGAAVLRPGLRRTRFAVVIAAVALAEVAPLVVGGARHDIIHIGFVAAFGLLGLAVAAGGLRAGRAPRVAAAALLVGLGACAFASFAHKWTVVRRDPRARYTFEEAYLVHNTQAAQIRERTSAGERIVDGRIGGWSYWFLARDAAVSHTLLPDPPLARSNYFPPEVWEQLADEIWRGRPPVMVLIGDQWQRFVAHRPQLATAYVQTNPVTWWRVDRAPGRGR